MLLLLAIIGSGCQTTEPRPYYLLTDGGAVVQAATKPKLKDGFYHFEDSGGREVSLNEANVVKVVDSRDLDLEKPLEYDIFLTDGSTLRAAAKPETRDGYYLFQDILGRSYQLPAMQVLKVEAIRSRKDRRNPVDEDFRNDFQFR